MVDGNDDDNRFEKMEGDYELGQWILTGSSKKKSGSSTKKKNSLWLFDLPKQFDTKGFAEKIKQLKSFTKNRPNTSSKSLKIFEFNLNGKNYEIDEEPIFHVQNSIALIPSSSKKKNEEDGESGSRTKANNIKNACFSTGEFRRSFIVRERQKTNTVLETTRSNQKKKKKKNMMMKQQQQQQQQLGSTAVGGGVQTRATRIHKMTVGGGVQTRATRIHKMSCKPIRFSPIGYVAPLQSCEKESKHLTATATKISKKIKGESTTIGKKKRKKSNGDSRLSSSLSSASKKRKKVQQQQHQQAEDNSSNVEKKRKKKKKPKQKRK